MPSRELYAFALPLLAMDLLFVLMNTSNVIMLGHFGNAEEVADYRVVQPAAHLNLVIMSTFALLFTPAAARLFAREDREGMCDLYWRTSLWVAVASFPVLATTTAFAEPVTVRCSATSYRRVGDDPRPARQSATTSAPRWASTASPCACTARQAVVVVSVIAAVLNLALNLILIPAYGAIGAGIGLCVTFLLHNVLKQAALTRGTGIPFFERKHLPAYASIVGVAGGARPRCRCSPTRRSSWPACSWPPPRSSSSSCRDHPSRSGIPSRSCGGSRCWGVSSRSQGAT